MGGKANAHAFALGGFSFTHHFPHRCLSCKAATLHRRGREEIGPADPLQTGPAGLHMERMLLPILYYPVILFTSHLPSQLLSF
jgi:hypothetical protein